MAPYDLSRDTIVKRRGRFNQLNLKMEARYEL